MNRVLSSIIDFAEATIAVKQFASRRLEIALIYIIKTIDGVDEADHNIPW